MRFELLGALLVADNKMKDRAFDASLTGDVAALWLMLLRQNND